MSRPHARQLIAIALLMSWPLTAQAVEVIHYDEYSSQFNEAAGQIQGATIAVQPGYAEGEAYGVVFRLGDEGHPNGMLDASDFPL